MFDSGGPAESWAPDESGGGSEQLSEEKAAQFQGFAQAAAQVRKEEKKAKKRDDGVADVILQFLTDDQRIHLATLISRLVARDCPSPFLLALLSLINEQCAAAFDEFAKEGDDAMATPEHTLAETGTALDADSQQAIAQWVQRLHMSMAKQRDPIVHALTIDHGQLDGSVLQLTTFILEEFLQPMNQNVEFERVQSLALGILHSVIGPHLDAAVQSLKEKSDG